MSIAALAVASIAGVAQATERPTPVETAAPVVGGQVQPVRKPAIKFASRMKSPSGIKVRGLWLKFILQEAGFEGKNLRMAWAVAMRESRGHHNSHNDNPATGDNSYGLFQINMLGSLGEQRRAKYGLEHNTDLFNPIRNAKIAYQMSNGGTNWSSWGIGKSSYNRGVSEPAVREWLAQYPKG